MLCIAEQKCRQRGRDFGTLFRKQYVLSRHDTGHFSGWKKRWLRGYILHHGAALRINSIEDQRGRPIGFLLGHAVTPEGKAVNDTYRINLNTNFPHFGDAFSAAANALSGRYLAIILTDTYSRVYGDPTYDIPLLANAETGDVGSSLGLLLHDSVKGSPRFSAKRVLSGVQTLGMQHTLDSRVQRSVSNHYLDLSDLTWHRHWPTQDVCLNRPSEDAPDITDAIANRLRSNVLALINEYDCALAVTGGFDSRALLAATHPETQKIKEFLCHRFHKQSRSDAGIAEVVLKTLDLELTHYFRKPVTARHKKDMRLKMGWSGTRGEFRAIPSIEEYPADHVILRGNIGELFRANQYRGDALAAPFLLRHGIRRLNVGNYLGSKNAVKVWKPDYMRWLDGIPIEGRNKAYDFGFIEHLLPNTQGAYLNGYGNIDMINPFNDRELIGLGISLPAAIRKDGGIARGIIERLHAPLLDIPFG